MSNCQDLDLVTLRGTLVSERLLVRPFGTEDITENYIAWLHDSDVVRFSNQRFRVHTQESCEGYLALFKESANHFLAIFDKISGDMIGTLTVYRSVPHGTADIGIMIGQKHVWGKGIGAEAFCLVLSALEVSGAIRKVTAGSLAENHGMLRIMEKAGMSYEATRHDQELLNGSAVDVVYYAKFFYE